MNYVMLRNIYRGMNDYKCNRYSFVTTTVALKHLHITS